MIIIYGNEPYCIDKHVTKLKEQYDSKVFDEINESEITTFLCSISFFETKPKAAVYNLIDKKDVTKLKPITGLNVIVYYYGACAEIKKFAEKNEVEVFLYEKYNMRQLYKFINNRIKADEQTIGLFVERIGYLNDKDVSLYDIVTNCEILSSLEDVSKSAIASLYGETVESKVFAIAGMLEKNNSLALSYASNCPAGEELAYLGALQRYYRVGWKKNYLHDVGNGYKVNPERAKTCLNILNSRWDDIVNGKLTAKLALVCAIKEVLALG
ncbi:MAG: hypothetical protein K6G88_11155 [Lachnospiraceae bacterium]|nr:hypothetical protein [Lachnospiraceae bacterium]